MSGANESQQYKEERDGKPFVFLGTGVLALVAIAGWGFFDSNFSYKEEVANMSAQVVEAEIPEPVKVIRSHVKTPDAVKALYMTSWVAGTKKLREPIIDLIDSTEINSIVIDIKDYTGRISFEPEDPELLKIGSYENRITDLDELIAELHAKNIYVIGRLSVFQDQWFVEHFPEYAVRRESDGGVWRDAKKIAWLDVGAKPVWEYVARIGKESLRRGFDEINFDYIRYPSDGNTSDISYTWAGTTTRRVSMKNFFAYIDETFRDKSLEEELAYKPVISVDFFGMTTTNHDDLGIGQVLEDALPHFDYIAPMVYPSHFPKDFFGIPNPNEGAYDIIKISMDKAVARSTIASTTPLKLRPWLQDFDYCGGYSATCDYDAAKVRAQIQATYDAGLTSWMLWSPSNKYTKEALLAK